MARPRKGEEKGHLLKSVSFNIYEKDIFEIGAKKIKVTGKDLVEILLTLKKRDPYLSEGEIVKALTAEAGYHHNPGNPGVALEHWFPSPIPFSQAAIEKGFTNTRSLAEKPKNAEKCDYCAGFGWTMKS